MIGPFELNSIYTGNAKELSYSIPDNSIDLIIADPVYQNHDDYKWLAKTGARVLKEGGNLIAQLSQYHLPQVIAAMDGYLDYVWVIAENIWGKNRGLFKHRIMVRWKPYVWYAKGKRMGGWVFDYIKGGGREKGAHEWQDSPRMFMELIYRLTTEDSIVFDPFTGSGTVPAACKVIGRKYLAFELDPETAKKAQERLETMQDPLFTLQFEQMELVC